MNNNFSTNPLSGKKYEIPSILDDKSGIDDFIKNNS